MQSDALKAKLLELAREAYTGIPDLNKGGCAIFAAEVAKALTNEGVAVAGIACDVEKWSIDDVRNRGGLVKPNVDALPLNHVALEVVIGDEKLFYDSYGFHTPGPEYDGWMEVADGRFTVEELEALAKQRRGWNKRFNRKEYIPVIKKLVKKEFIHNQERTYAKRKIEKDMA